MKRSAIPASETPITMLAKKFAILEIEFMIYLLLGFTWLKDLRFVQSSLSKQKEHYRTGFLPEADALVLSTLIFLRRLRVGYISPGQFSQPDRKFKR